MKKSEKQCFIQEASNGNSNSYFVSNSYRYGVNSQERDDEVIESIKEADTSNQNNEK